MAASITKGYTFGSTELVTSTKLHSLVDDATIASIARSETASSFFNNTVTAQTDATLTASAAHKVIVCDTTSNAIAITLPEAADNLGLELTIYLETDGGDNVTVARAGADVLDSSDNTLATLADAEDFLRIVAVSDNRWLIISDNGVAYSTP